MTLNKRTLPWPALLLAAAALATPKGTIRTKIEGIY